MRIQLAVIQFTVFLSSSLYAEDSKEAPTIFLLSTGAHQRWCAYFNEKQWKTDIDKFGSEEVATALFKDGSLSVVNLTTEDESGDWVAYDRYSVRNEGQIGELQRKVNVVARDVSSQEVYVLDGGHVLRKSIVQHRLSSGKGPAPKGAWVPELAVIKNSGEFPFSSLLKSLNELKSKRTLCR